MFALELETTRLLNSGVEPARGQWLSCQRHVSKRIVEVTILLRLVPAAVPELIVRQRPNGCAELLFPSRRQNDCKATAENLLLTKLDPTAPMKHLAICILRHRQMQQEPQDRSNRFQTKETDKMDCDYNNILHKSLRHCSMQLCGAAPQKCSAGIWCTGHFCQTNAAPDTHGVALPSSVAPRSKRRDL